MDTSHEPCAKFNLFFRCSQLREHGFLGTLRPYCVLFTLRRQSMWEAGRTEVASVNTCNPTFNTPVAVNFYFEKRCNYRVRVLNDEGRGDNRNEVLGETEFPLPSVVASRGSSAVFPLGGSGALHLAAKELGINGADLIALKFAGGDLRKQNILSGADSYLKVFRVISPEYNHLVYQGPVVKGISDPVWDPLPRELTLADITGPDLSERTVHIEVWHKNMVKKENLVGEVTLSVKEMFDSAASKSESGFELQKSTRSTYRGRLIVLECRITHVPTFSEYLAAGVEIDLAVSIDFTGSNGHPCDPRSLHYIGDPQHPNHYVRAITSVGEILIQYDKDKRVAAFGFGAVVPHTGSTSHFFSLNSVAAMQPTSPYVDGVEGILRAYSACLPVVHLSGPTNFCPTIQAVTKQSRLDGPHGVYTVLVIITDGEITDMASTTDAVVDADDAPLSIIIIGVGYDCDFTRMVELDCDDDRLHHSSGRISRRDLVQFVPMRKFEGVGMEALAAEVLYEVPSQFLTWAKLVNFKLPERKDSVRPLDAV